MIADLGASAGLRVLQMELAKASRSTAKVARPDFAITTSALFSRLTSTMDANRRFTDEDVLKLGFKHVMFEDMITLWDAKCTARAFYYMNTNKMKIKCLKMPNMQNIVVNDKQYSLPIVIEKMRDDIDTVNYVSLMYLKYGLVTNDLSSGGVLSNCTE